MNYYGEDYRESLSFAIRSGNLDQVKHLIDGGILNINLQGLEVRNAIRNSLCLASSCGYLKIVEYLLKNDNLTVAQDQDALHRALCASINSLSCNSLDRVNSLGKRISRASSEDILEIVKYLIEKANAPLRDQNGCSVLVVAVECGDFKIVEYLIEQANAIAEDQDGMSALYSAVKTFGFRHLEILKYLIEKVGVDVNLLSLKDSEGRTALHFAAKNLNLHGVIYLIETARIDVNSKDRNGNTALHYICGFSFSSIYGFPANSDDLKRSEIAKYLIEKTNIDVNLQDLVYRKTALHDAVIHNNFGVATCLIEKSEVDANLKDINGFTAFSKFRDIINILNFAFTGKYFNGDRLEMLKSLIKKGIVVVNFQYQNEWTALHFFAENGSLEIVKYLIEEENFDLNLKDINGHSALHFATKNSDLEVLKYLIDQRIINVNSLDCEGQTVLHFAIKNNSSLEVVEQLLETARVDVNLKDLKGKTALHIAAEYGSLNMLKHLIENKIIDFNLKDLEGRTALHIAAKNNYLDIVKYLVEKARVDINLKDSEGWTALHIAAINGDLETVEYLIERSGKLEEDINNLTIFLADIFDFVCRDAYFRERQSIAKLLIFYLIKLKGLDVEEPIALKEPNDDFTREMSVYWKECFNEIKKAKEIHFRDSTLYDFLKHYTTKTLLSYSQCSKLQNMQVVVKKDEFYHYGYYLQTLLKVAKERKGVIDSALQYIEYVPFFRTPIDSNQKNDEKKMNPTKIVKDIFPIILSYLSNEDILNLEIAALCSAAQNAQEGVLEELLKNGARVNQTETNGYTSLHLAASQGHLEVIKVLVNSYGANVNLKGKNDGYTPLHLAASHGHLEVVKVLVHSYGADVNLKGKNDGYTPLHLAASQDYLEVVKSLLDLNRSSVNLKGENDGYTPLHLAVKNNCLKTVKYLIKEARANVTISANDGNTPLDFIKSSTNEEMIKLLGKDNTDKYNYAFFILSGALAVGSILTIPFLVECTILALAAATFLILGCYRTVFNGVNTTLNNAEVNNAEVNNAEVNNDVNPSVLSV